MMEVFASVNARGTSILMATHDAELIRRHPRRTLTLRDGGVEYANP
jgi:cell division transport system ATP-binding protein